MTFIYDEDVPEVSPWERLAPAGLMWGNDPDVEGPGEGVLNETWIAPDISGIFQSKLGRDGRLNGPVDNPRSSCLSCHSTAQRVESVTASSGSNIFAFRGTGFLPPSSCTTEEAMTWFRNILGGEPFGVMNFCQGPEEPVPSNLVPLDYSLQLQVAMESAFYFGNPNPCATAAGRGQSVLLLMPLMAMEDSEEAVSLEVALPEPTPQLYGEPVPQGYPLDSPELRR